MEMCIPDLLSLISQFVKDETVKMAREVGSCTIHACEVSTRVFLPLTVTVVSSTRVREILLRVTCQLYER